jgi:plastocyanin
MRRSVFALVATLAICASACGGGGGSTGPSNNGANNGTGNNGSNNNNTTVPPNTVIARAGDTFDPASLTVGVGTTVSFVFEATGHNVTFSPVGGRPADISGSNSNTTITRTFSQTGTFAYTCTLHAGMNGTVIVQ